MHPYPDKLLHCIVIVIQRPVHVQVLHVLADDFTGTGCDLAGMELTEVPALPGSTAAPTLRNGILLR
jgi:hypothetical protein